MPRAAGFLFMLVTANQSLISEASVDLFKTAAVCLVVVAMCGCVGCDSDVRAVKIAAWKGDAMAQYNLGVMYEKGNNLREMNSDGSSSPSKVVLPQDYAQAAKWYRAAAEQGLADAQNDLGKMYLKGKGVTQDHAEAMKWRRLAAERGHVGAQYWLGAKYHHSIGVPQDDAEAVKWYRLAADQGDAMAQEALGDLYRQGKGVPRDYAEAVRLYRLSAEQGWTVAHLTLGELYEKGEGVPQDSVEAYAWYYVGDKCGLSNAWTSRKELAGRLTPDQVSAGQKRGTELLDKISSKQ